MVKHELGDEPRKYNLRAKKLRTEVTFPTSDPASTDPVDVQLRTNGVAADSRGKGKGKHNGGIARKSTPKRHSMRKDKMTLDKLPAELLREIYLDLDAPAMLAFKLVSKTLYATTIDQRGLEVVDVPEK